MANTRDLKSLASASQFESGRGHQYAPVAQQDQSIRFLIWGSQVRVLPGAPIFKKENEMMYTEFEQEIFDRSILNYENSAFFRRTELNYENKTDYYDEFWDTYLNTEEELL